ncbi:MAG: HAMP domain-containing sensor histidine kinase, partial [Bdellovibrionota bacterium]|nr:HAMP domain-containing sensor histidine kinase [Bdellovibrionota bacterium]
MKKSNKNLIILFALLAFALLGIGTWWLYLLVNLKSNVGNIPNGISLYDHQKFINMVAWEGATFLLLISSITAIIFAYYLKDQKKTRNMQAFFSSLTHELKTPLASIRLQADVINSLLENSQNKRLQNLSDRMIEDTKNLETQMDKILQLSRMEQGGNLNPRPLNIYDFIRETLEKWSLGEQDFQISSKDKYLNIMADPFALELILRNLLENSKNHSPREMIKITISQKCLHEVLLQYTDNGIFEGDTKKLGTLFYKYNSPKGSGIGLY